MLSIGIVIPTLNAAHLLARCLKPIKNSSLNPRILVIDSSSADGTVEVAKLNGVEAIVISREAFNHGTTREMGRKYLGTDIVVMMTPDIIPNEQTLSNLLEPILSGKAAVAYAKQLPHDGADFFEAFPREFNYPNESHIRGIEDMEKYGAYTFFCSDSCAAYLNRTMDEIGGFQEVLFGEDTIAVAHLLRKGYKIAYCADAAVKHSHGYNLKQEFHRYFDIGLSRRQNEALLTCDKSVSRRGASFVVSMLKRLAQEQPWLVPYGILQSFVKWMGYRLGHASIRAPTWFKRRLSSFPTYWK